MKSWNYPKLDSSVLGLGTRRAALLLAFAGTICLPWAANTRADTLNSDALHVDIKHGKDVSVTLTLSKAQREELAAAPSLPRAAEKMLWICLSPEKDENNPGRPIYARYSVKKSKLILRPRFPLRPGIDYEANTTLPSGEKVRRPFQLPKSSIPAAPSVVSVFPSGNELPANVLKFYVLFSTPMREGREIFEAIRIEDESGRPVRDPWRQVELWDDAAMRLTLWIHPGRIKKGVNLREEFGPVFEPGKRYRIRFTTAIRSADGIPIRNEYVKSFQTTGEDHDRPNPSTWTISKPKRKSLSPLTVTFPDSLDHALLHRHIGVFREDRRIDGRISVGKDEREWVFTPLDAWDADSSYGLRVSPRLEDQAGNTPLRLFDTDLQGAEPRPLALSRPVPLAP